MESLTEEGTWERVREREREREPGHTGAGEGAKKERESQAHSPLTTEPDVGFDLMTPRSRPEPTSSRMLNR